jgi:hypothetical protein
VLVGTFDVGDTPGRDEDTPDERAHLCALIRRSLTYVEALPPIQRETVLLYVEGVSVPEMARSPRYPWKRPAAACAGHSPG